jgi:hypothetical protein
MTHRQRLSLHWVDLLVAKLDRWACAGFPTTKITATFTATCAIPADFQGLSSRLPLRSHAITDRK